MTFNRKLDMRHWLHANGFEFAVVDNGFWLSKDATRTTNRGTERKKRYMMFVIVVPNGAEPLFRELALKRSIDLVAKTRQPRTERQQGTFAAGHQQNIRLIKDGDVIVQCYGAHILRLNGRAPSARFGQWMMWDDKPVNGETLMSLFRFERDPDTLNPLEAETMHKPRLKDPALFEISDLEGDD